MQEIIIRQEEKSGKSESLRVQILIQPLLYPFNHVIALLQILIQSRLQARIKNIRVLESA